MSSFTDRIRARTRRHNERQAGIQPRHARREVAAQFAPLSLDVDQVAAIKKALGQTPIDEAVLQDLVREGKLTWAEVNAMSATELVELAGAIELYKRRTTGTQAAIVPAPPGNAPGEFDLGQLEETGTAAHMAAEQLDDSTPREPQEATRASAPSIDIETTSRPGEVGGASSVSEEPPALPAAPATADSTLERFEFPKSSNVRAAAVDIHGVLTVEFANGKHYRYANFTIQLLHEWRDAKSAGSWFHHNVKSKPDRHPVLEG